MKLLLAAALIFFGAGLGLAPAQQFTSAWDQEPDRTWIGADFWANRLQDWALQDKKLVCVAGKAPMRTVHLLTNRLGTDSKKFELAVTTGGKGIERGFLIGAGGSGLDYRAAAMIHAWSGPGGGVYAGIDAAGHLFFADNEIPENGQPKRLQVSPKAIETGDVTLVLKGEAGDTSWKLRLAAKKTEGSGELGNLTVEIPTARMAGNFALVANPTGLDAKPWFSNLELSGTDLINDPASRFGPIAGTQYTLNDGVLTLTAQMLPIGADEPHVAFLEVNRNDEWIAVAETEIDEPGWIARFEVLNWEDEKEAPYRIVFGDFSWEGVIRLNPVDRDEVVVAGMAGNLNFSPRVGEDNAVSDWATGVWFPHADLISNVVKHRPDLLFFSGNQVAPPREIPSDEKELALDYLYRWYQWHWAFRDLTRDTPSITLPGAHDFYQQGLWGEGGRAAKSEAAGGFVQSADFVQLVQRTQSGHLPDPFDPTPAAREIPVLFTGLNWGRIGFAVLEDRKWKSGCAEHGLPPTGGRPDQLSNPQVDPRQLDLPGLHLLGERQLNFLDQWTADWAQTDLKVVLSQSIFANLATHQGGSQGNLDADLNSNGWPQTGRNQAVERLRKGFTFHLAGDDHLASVLQYGIESHSDSGYAFGLPSVANEFPYMWNPRAEGRNRPENSPFWMGEHLDGFKNPVTVLAAANPGPDFGMEPKELYNGMCGYGIVRFKKQNREIQIECWPRFADSTAADAKQFDGWPVTIAQQDNYKRKPGGYLPPIEVDGMENAVIQVREAATKQLIYALRIKGRKITPWVFEPGRYDVRIGEPDTGLWTELKGIEASVDPYSEARLIEF